MAQTGLNEYLDNIGLLAMQIDLGRKALSTPKQAENGREAYSDGIRGMSTLFKEIQATHSPAIIVQSERVFIMQELSFCDKSEKLTIHRLNFAISSFNDAMRSLSAVENPAGYTEAEKTYLQNKNNRVQSVPKDAFHKACNSHISFLQQSLRTPGLNLEEKALYQLRAENMKVAVSLYIEKQKAALGLPANAKTKSNDREI